MDIPRIFMLSGSEYPIDNPFTAKSTPCWGVLA
jgi:hypothetical protein